MQNNINGENCFVIAEIGVNHAGSVALAKKMIDAAKNSGADAVKFQMPFLAIEFCLSESELSLDH